MANTNVGGTFDVALAPRNHPGKVYVPLAILDGEIDRAPEAHVNVAESVHWSALPDDGVPRFDRFD